METKLAVLIVGEPDSGKSTTIRYFEQVNDENHKEKEICRIGWRHLQFFLGKLDALSCIVYFVPSSPTESHKSLEKKLKEHYFVVDTPEMMIIAEQLNGEEYESTKEFLRKMDYKIIEFTIDNRNTGTTWSRWTNNKEDILSQRVKEITDAFIEYIMKMIQED